MAGCRADPSIERVVTDGVSFPLGVYPIEPIHPAQGYSVDFESADGDEEGEWEEWPDRYVFDAVVTADRLEPLVHSLLGLFPMRVYPILDILGHDAYREIDPYISYDATGLDRILDALIRYRDFFLEDGLTGFGAMCDDPFIYLFVDEHKIVTVRCRTELRDRVERTLAAFDLKAIAEPAGADAAAHEHRTVLIAPDDEPDLLTPEEIVERLVDEWHLTLNIDAHTNIDDDGRELGTTGWRCLVRATIGRRVRYAEVYLTADSLALAEELALNGLESLLRNRDLPPDATAVTTDRIRPEDLADVGAIRVSGGRLPPARVVRSRWLTGS